MCSKLLEQAKSDANVEDSDTLTLIKTLLLNIIRNRTAYA